MSADEPPVTVYRSRDGAACREHALVLTALGIDHAMGTDEGAHVLVVARATRRARASSSSASTTRTTRARARAAARTPASGADAAIAYALVLVAVWICERQHTFGREWEPAGEGAAGLLIGGSGGGDHGAHAARGRGAPRGQPDLRRALRPVRGQLAGSGLAAASCCSPARWATRRTRCCSRPAHVDRRVHGGVRRARPRRGAALLAACGRAAVDAATLGARRRAALLLFYLGTEGERTDVLAHVTGFPLGPAARHAARAAAARRAAARALAVVVRSRALAALAGAWAAAFAAG